MFWMIKPALIASTSTNTVLDRIFDLMFQIVLLITTTTLAYVSFNKHYKYLTKLDFIHNCHYFSYLYLFDYLVTIVCTYSITIFVVLFGLGNNYMNEFEWGAVIYPQCGWLFFIKLYFNEISQAINIIVEYNKQHKTKSLFQFVSNVNMDIKITHAISNLFIFQIFVIIASFASCWIYIGYIASGACVRSIHCDGWNVIWYWQLLLSLLILFTMPFATYCSFNKNCKCCCTCKRHEYSLQETQLASIKYRALVN